MNLQAIVSNAPSNGVTRSQSSQPAAPAQSDDVAVIADRRLLKMNASGNETRTQIIELQALLLADSEQKPGELQAGQFNVGQFDQTTKDAVIAYQTKHGLKVDGEVGQQTWGDMKGVKVPPGVDKLKGAGEPEGWAGTGSANGATAARRTDETGATDPAAKTPAELALQNQIDPSQADPTQADPQYGASDEELRQASQGGALRSLGHLGAGIVQTNIAKRTAAGWATRGARKAEEAAAKNGVEGAAKGGIEAATKEGVEGAAKETAALAKTVTPELEAAERAVAEASTRATAKGAEVTELAAKLEKEPGNKLLQLQLKNAKSEQKLIGHELAGAEKKALKLADYAAKPLRYAEDAAHAANAAKAAHANVSQLETEAAEWAKKAAKNPGANTAKSLKKANEALEIAKTQAKHFDAVAARTAKRAAGPAELVAKAIKTRGLANDLLTNAQALRAKSNTLVEMAAKDPKKWGEASRQAKGAATRAENLAKRVEAAAESEQKLAIREGGTFAKAGETATEVAAKGGKTGLIAGAKNLAKGAGEKLGVLAEKTGIKGAVETASKSKLVGLLKKPMAGLADRATGIVSVLKNGSKGAAEIAAKKGAIQTVEAGTKAAVDTLAKSGRKEAVEGAAKVAAEVAARAAEKAAAEGVAKGGLKLFARIGGHLAAALPIAGTAVAIGFTAYDAAHAYKVSHDPKAPAGKKFLAKLTAWADLASCIPVLGVAGAVVSTISSVAESVAYP